MPARAGRGQADGRARPTLQPELRHLDFISSRRQALAVHVPLLQRLRRDWPMSRGAGLCCRMTAQPSPAQPAPRRAMLHLGAVPDVASLAAERLARWYKPNPLKAVFGR